MIPTGDALGKQILDALNMDSEGVVRVELVCDATREARIIVHKDIRDGAKTVTHTISDYEIKRKAYGS